MSLEQLIVQMVLFLELLHTLLSLVPIVMLLLVNALTLEPLSIMVKRSQFTKNLLEHVIITALLEL